MDCLLLTDQRLQQGPPTGSTSDCFLVLFLAPIVTIQHTERFCLSSAMLNKTVTAFPPELFCLIMDECSHDTLNSCSLVSKAWQHTAQRLVLRKMIIFMDLPTRNLSALTDFLDLRPDLAPHIHAVRIRSSSYLHVIVDLSNIRSSLASLPHLQSVYVGGIQITNRPFLLADNADTPENLLPEIELLELEFTSVCSTFHWADGISDVLGSFSSIGTLVFKSVDIYLENRSPLAPPAPVQRRLPSDRLQRVAGLNLAGRNDDSVRLDMKRMLKTYSRIQGELKHTTDSVKCCPSTKASTVVK